MATAHVFVKKNVNLNLNKCVTTVFESLQIFHYFATSVTTILHHNFYNRKYTLHEIRINQKIRFLCPNLSNRNIFKTTEPMVNNY